MPPEVSYQSIAVTADPATSGYFRFAARGGQVILPAGSSITSITWYTMEKVGGVRTACYTEDLAAPAAVVQTNLAASRAYPIPNELFGCLYLIPVGNAAGSIIVTDKG